MAATGAMLLQIATTMKAAACVNGLVGPQKL
jgi:hypothetical protein